MGGTKSKTTNEVFTDIAFKVVQRGVSSCVQAATQSQVMEVKRTRGDVHIKGVDMRQSMSVDMKCALSSDMQSRVQAEIINQIQQYADAQGVALLSGLGSTKAEVESRIETIFDTYVEQETIQESVMQNLQEQRLSVEDTRGNVIISNVSMEQSAEIVAEAIMTAAGYSEAIAEIADIVDQTAKAKEEGPLDSLFKMIGGIVNSWVFMIVGIVLVAALVIIFLFKYLFTTETGAALVTGTMKIAEAKAGL